MSVYLRMASNGKLEIPVGCDLANYFFRLGQFFEE